MKTIYTLILIESPQEATSRRPPIDFSSSNLYILAGIFRLTHLMLQHSALTRRGSKDHERYDPGTSHQDLHSLLLGYYCRYSVTGCVYFSNQMAPNGSSYNFFYISHHIILHTLKQNLRNMTQGSLMRSNHNLCSSHFEVQKGYRNYYFTLTRDKFQILCLFRCYGVRNYGSIIFLLAIMQHIYTKFSSRNTYANVLSSGLANKLEP